MGGAVASLPRFNTACDCLDRTSNSFLNEGFGAVGLVSKAVVEGRVRPLIGAVAELIGSLIRREM